MDEIIVIELGLFHEYKPCNIVKLASAKIIEIFALDCFNEAKLKQVTAAMKPRPGRGHDHMSSSSSNSNNTNTNNSSSSRSFYNGNNGNNREVKAPRARIGIQSYHEKLIREITSNLNKINGSNLDIVYKRIEKVIDLNNVNEIVNIVLVKSCTNGTYLHHFVSLLDKLTAAATYQDIVTDCIRAFANGFIDNLTKTFEQLALYDYDDYDQFCKFIKEKNQIVNTNKLILIYMDRDSRDDIIQCTPDLYFEKLVGMIDVSQPVHLQDMLVQVVADFFATKNSSNEHTCQQLAHIYHDRLEGFISTKSKFLFQDTMRANELKNSNVFICKSRRRR